MAAAGYSETPLWKKLGIKPGSIVQLIDPPPEYHQWLESDIKKQLAKKNEVPDIVHLFAKNNKSFESELKKLAAAARKNPAVAVWVSWYKRSAGIPTDLTEDVIRRYALKNGWVDVKVCAVSEHWSGLKLVIPLAKR